MVTDPQGPLLQAQQWREQGQWDLARSAYQSLLARVPDHLECLYELGCLEALVAPEDPTALTRAEQVLARACALQPNNLEIVTTLAQVHLRLGHAQAALDGLVKGYQLAKDRADVAVLLIDALGALEAWALLEQVAPKVLQTVSQTVPVHAALARAWRQQGDVERALTSYDAAINAINETSPKVLLAETRLRRGRLLLQMGKSEAAFEDARRAEVDCPSLIQAALLQAVIWRARGDYAQAEAACRRALSQQPDDADSMAQLATIRDLQQDHLQAEALFRQVLQRAPGRRDVLFNLGGCLMAQDRPIEAVDLYRACLAHDPKWKDAWANLGSALMLLARYAEAQQALEQALNCPGEGEPEIRYNLAWVQLVQGNYAEGWKNYECRWQMGSFSSPQRHFTVPQWKGEDLADGSVYLHAEQGVGDAIQMLRLVPVVASQVARVVLEVPATLVTLAQRAFQSSGEGHGVIVVAADYTATDQMVIPCSHHCPLMSLPWVLGLTIQTIPGAAAYLTPSSTPVPPNVEAWRADNKDRLKVGFVWAGAATNKIDRYRSLPPVLVPTIFDCPGIAWASLQIGPRAGEGDGYAFELLDGVSSFDDTAARLAVLDLVIGVDTAVLHLAAALGKESWMLIPYAPDYRWLATGETSGWYPSLKLFRQTERGDWRGVLERVGQALLQCT